MSQLTDLLSVLIEAGPRVPAAMVKVDSGVTHFRAGVADFQEAGVIIVGRKAAVPAELNVTEQSKVSELAALLDQHEGVAGDRAGMLSNLFLFLKEHPELISLLLTLLK